MKAVGQRRAIRFGDEPTAMAIERTFQCDGPDCDSHARTASTKAPKGFLVVTGDGGPMHFCMWDCVLRYAATKEPTEVIPAGSLDDR